MKTTIEIADALFAEARRLADREGLTLRTLVEQGLRKILSERKERPPFRLRNVTFKGQGLQPEFQGGSWGRLRQAVYEGRGG